MQRRAAAAYVAFFLVIAAGAYGVIATTDNPSAYVAEEEAEYTLAAGDEIEVDGRTYTVSEISAEESEGGHGGGGGVEYSGTLTWTNESAVQTETWEANSTITYGPDNSTYRVHIANVSNPTAVQLRPEPPEEANPRFENGSQVVDVDIDDDGFVETGVPVAQYRSEFDNRSNATIGNSVTINGTERTISSLTNESVTFRWTQPQEEEVDLGQGQVAELRGTEYLVYFEGEEAVHLDDNASTEYYQRGKDHDAMSKRINGFWAVTLISVVSAGGMIGLAFLPRRE